MFKRLYDRAMALAATIVTSLVTSLVILFVYFWAKINIFISHKWSLQICSYIVLLGASHIVTLAPAEVFIRPSAQQLYGGKINIFDLYHSQLRLFRERYTLHETGFLVILTMAVSTLAGVCLLRMSTTGLRLSNLAVKC